MTRPGASKQLSAFVFQGPIKGVVLLNLILLASVIAVKWFTRWNLWMLWLAYIHMSTQNIRLIREWVSVFVGPDDFFIDLLVLKSVVCALGIFRGAYACVALNDFLKYRGVTIEHAVLLLHHRVSSVVSAVTDLLH